MDTCADMRMDMCEDMCVDMHAYRLSWLGVATVCHRHVPGYMCLLYVFRYQCRRAWIMCLEGGVRDDGDVLGVLCPGRRGAGVSRGGVWGGGGGGGGGRVGVLERPRNWDETHHNVELLPRAPQHSSWERLVWHCVGPQEVDAGCGDVAERIDCFDQSWNRKT